MNAVTPIRTLDQQHYSERGYLLRPGLYSDSDVAAMRDEAGRLWNDLDLSRADVHWRDHETLGRVADRLDPVRTHSTVFARMSHHPKMLALAEDLLGGPAFVLKDKLIMKRPGTAGYGAHQDFPYWSGIGLTSDQVLTALISLDDVTPAHGPIEIWPGLHHTTLPPHPHDPLDVDLASLVGRQPFAATVKAGDVVLFHALAPHASRTNRAAGDRRTYLVTYARDFGDPEAVIARYEAQLATVHKVHKATV